MVKFARLFASESGVRLFYGAEALETWEYCDAIVIRFNHVDAVWVDLASPVDSWVRLLVRTEKTHVILSVRGSKRIAGVEKGVQMLKTVSVVAGRT